MTNGNMRARNRVFIMSPVVVAALLLMTAA